MAENQKNEVATNVAKEISDAEVVQFGKRDFNTYNRLISNIDRGFSKASEAYIAIGCSLWQIHHNEYYRIDNYKSIADFALEKFEIKKATTHNYIKVIEKFGQIEDGKPLGLKDQFKGFKCSQLVNMLTFTPEQIEQVKPDWKVKQIIEFGKAPLLLEDEDGDADKNTDSSVSSEDDNTVLEGEVMTAPEIETGRTNLGTFDSFEQLLKAREALENAFMDMQQDKNFQNKKIRYVLELAFE